MEREIRGRNTARQEGKRGGGELPAPGAERGDPGEGRGPRGRGIRTPSSAGVLGWGMMVTRGQAALARRICLGIWRRRPRGRPQPGGGGPGGPRGMGRRGGGSARGGGGAFTWPCARNLYSQHASTTWEPEGSRCAAESLGLILCTIKHSAASPSCSYTSSTLNKHNDDIRCNSR